MFQPQMGTVPLMQETPICAEVERDLELSVDELLAATAPTPPAPVTAEPPQA
jgi:hypothetical protein